MRSLSAKMFFVAVVGLIFYCSAVRAQSDGTWMRVMTAEDHALDVDLFSLRFAENGAVSARFRTVLNKAEPLVNEPKAKYKIRIETVEFNPSSYRNLDVKLLDGDGNTLASRSEPTVWRPRSAASGKWVGVLRSLPPFGDWRVVSYRLLDHSAKDTSDLGDLEKLLGSSVYLDVNGVRAGKKNCTSPNYRSKKLTDPDLEKLLGRSLENLDPRNLTGRRSCSYMRGRRMAGRSEPIYHDQLDENVDAVGRCTCGTRVGS
jgi:hypothetical protein